MGCPDKNPAVSSEFQRMSSLDIFDTSDGTVPHKIEEVQNFF